MKLLIFASLLLCSLMLNAQDNNAQFQVPQAPIPVEVMIGGKESMYQMTVDKRLAPGSRFKFFNLINYEVDNDELTPIDYIIQSIGYYEFAKGFDAGAGANLKAFGGFKPVVSVEYTNFSRDKGLVVQPVYEVHQDGEFSTMAMFEWHPVNQRTFQPYFRLQVMSSWKKKHSYSYQYWRLGARYKIVSFGPALNVEYFGPKAESVVNWGCFFNFEIN